MEAWQIFAVMRAALLGVLVAAEADFAAFKAWQSYEEARRYDWRLAAWRWAKGAVLGVAAHYGLGSVM